MALIPEVIEYVSIFISLAVSKLQGFGWKFAETFADFTKLSTQWKWLQDVKPSPVAYMVCFIIKFFELSPDQGEFPGQLTCQFHITQNPLCTYTYMQKPQSGKGPVTAPTSELWYLVGGEEQSGNPGVGTVHM